MKRYWGYVRVSVQGDRSGESFISPDEQRRKINGWAQMQDVEIVDFKDDINVSAEKSRPGPRLHPGATREQGGGRDRRLQPRPAQPTRRQRRPRVDRDASRATARTSRSSNRRSTPSDPVTGEFVLTLFLALNRMERQRAKVRWAEAGENAIKRKIHTAQIAVRLHALKRHTTRTATGSPKRDDREGQNDTAASHLFRTRRTRRSSRTSSGHAQPARVGVR